MYIITQAVALSAGKTPVPYQQIETVRKSFLLENSLLSLLLHYAKCDCNHDKNRGHQREEATNLPMSTDLSRHVVYSLIDFNGYCTISVFGAADRFTLAGKL